MFQIFSGNIPFHEPEFNHQLDLMKAIVKGSRPTRPSHEYGLENQTWYLIVSCWKSKAIDRPTATDIVTRLPLVETSHSASETGWDTFSASLLRPTVADENPFLIPFDIHRELKLLTERTEDVLTEDAINLMTTSRYVVLAESQTGATHSFTESRGRSLLVVKFAGLLRGALRLSFVAACNGYIFVSIGETHYNFAVASQENHNHEEEIQNEITRLPIRARENAAGLVNLWKLIVEALLLVCRHPTITLAFWS